MTSGLRLQRELRKLADPAKAVFFQRFFKTGPGHYAHGDKFLGIAVPQTRTIAKKYSLLTLPDISKLLKSPLHEERLAALLILVDQCAKGDSARRQKIVAFYLKHTSYINNWDLVDLSADKILGEYLLESPDNSQLTTLAHSKNLWERRIAIIATYAFIKAGKPEATPAIAKQLLTDPHDLIHKAVGWMLREVGKRCSRELLEAFLKQHYKTMPRTTLRYAIEHFPKPRQQAYLQGSI